MIKDEKAKLINLKIDGHPIQVERDTTVIKAAKELGIKIPTLCYHELLEPSGRCRLCTVEVLRKGRSRLVTACNYPIREEVEILTASKKVMNIRRMILEFLLARCPSVKIIRDLADEMGIKASRFPCEDETCILCGLCVQVCNDIVGAHVLCFAEMGIDRRVTVALEKETEKCIGCGACAVICPTGHIKIEPSWEQPGEPREFYLGPTTAIYIPTYQAVPKIPVIDHDACIHFKTDECKVCEMVCEPKAINHKQEPTTVEFDVGQIIVATGFDLFDSKKMSQYGYGVLDNVYSGLEMEQLLNSSGPTNGKILLKNGKEPRAIGIIHCVGSRDENHHAYCSRVCCMYALKFSHLIKDRSSAEVYQFYIDMRAFGKGYEEFYSRILDEGVNIIRGKVAEVVKAGWSQQDEGVMMIRCEDTLIKKYREIPVDMVVLCNALSPTFDTDDIRRRFSMSCSPGGFFLEKHPKLDPTSTSTDGVYIAGCCQGPKDIPDTVAQASAAAGRALAFIAKAEVEIEPITSAITAELCSGCRICIGVCPYNAIKYLEKDKHSEINDALCKGCGSCVAACPSGAAYQQHYRDSQLMAEIEGLLVKS